MLSVNSVVLQKREQPQQAECFAVNKCGVGSSTMFYFLGTVFFQFCCGTKQFAYSFYFLMYRHVSKDWVIQKVMQKNNAFIYLPCSSKNVANLAKYTY